MPSNKIISVSILCLALIVSTWLLSKNTTKSSSVSQNNINAVETVSARPYIESTKNNEWQKMLVKIDPKYQVAVDLTKSKPDSFDETTLTAQAAKDFFSQYLLAKQGGSEVTQEEVSKIAQNVSSLPQYTKTSGAVYLTTNLNIDPATDALTLKKYKDAVNLALKTWTSQIKENPLTILGDAIKSEDENQLKRFDPLIFVGKNLINDFINMSVQKNAVNVHLALLNSFSNLLSDTEAMKVAIKDPLKAMAAIGQYNKHISEFNIALKNMNSFLLQ